MQHSQKHVPVFSKYGWSLMPQFFQNSHTYSFHFQLKLELINPLSNFIFSFF